MCDKDNAYIVQLQLFTYFFDGKKLQLNGVFYSKLLIINCELLIIKKAL
jgi:hypothetical protein